MAIDPESLNVALEVLAAAQQMAPNDAQYLELERAAAHLRKTGKKKRRLARKRVARQNDQEAVNATVLARGRAAPEGAVPADTRGRALHNERSCYVCKAGHKQLHHYYPSMCEACGDLSFGKRDRETDMRGRRALVTGGRTKIGYAVALRLLRNGADVTVTTRFPKDAARRYCKEADMAVWEGRLRIVGADFRRLPEFVRLVRTWRAGPAFDILINNAAQTVWHPPSYYRELWRQELEPHEGPPWIDGRDSLAALPSAKTPDNGLAVVDDWASHLFPDDTYDEFGNAVDLRRSNSWVQCLGEIDAVEMIEVQVVNNIAPFILCNDLRPNMMRSGHDKRFIVNVTAVEGRFSREKLPRHPHTNMAKVALNMLTRTSAEQCAKDGIYMVSVDPGWMSHEGPQQSRERAAAAGFHPPLESVDSAARILDPIVEGITGEPLFGVQLKDFREVPW